MTSVSQSGTQIQLNALAFVNKPIVAGSAPTGVPGLYWVDSGSSYAVKMWTGSTWVVAAAPYLALLTADPGTATTIAALQECADSGYARVQVTFDNASAATPSIIENSAVVTFGPFSVNMALPVRWAALVTAASGTTGLLLATATLDEPQQVLATQYVNIAATKFQMTTS